MKVRPGEGFAFKPIGLALDASGLLKPGAGFGVGGLGQGDTVGFLCGLRQQVGG